MQALADEWSEIGVKVNCVNPERTQTAMRLRAFGAEQPGTLLSSMAVAMTAVDVLVSELTGHVIDVRLTDPLNGARLPRPESGVPDVRPEPAAFASEPVRSPAVPAGAALSAGLAPSTAGSARFPAESRPDLTPPGWAATDQSESEMYRNLQPFVANHFVRLASAAVLLASYPLLLVAALLPTGTAGRLPGCWLFVAVAIVSYLAELWARRVVPDLMNTLNWVQVGSSCAGAFRELALIVLLARALSPSSALVAFAGGLMVLHAVRGIYSALAIYVTQCRTLPVITRNVDLAALRIPNAPPPWLVRNDVQKLLYLDTIPVAGGLAAALTADFTWGFAGISLGLAVSAILCGDHGRFARRNRHLNNAARVLSAVQKADHCVSAGGWLYLSGSRNSIHQVNMWLSNLARLQQPTLIILRDQYLVPLLGRTSLPVVSIADQVDLMNFKLPSVRVALFPANTAQNIVPLRIPRVGSAFIGHGEAIRQRASTRSARSTTKSGSRGRRDATGTCARRSASGTRTSSRSADHSSRAFGRPTRAPQTGCTRYCTRRPGKGGPTARSLSSSWDSGSCRRSSITPRRSGCSTSHTRSPGHATLAPRPSTRRSSP